MTDLRLEIHGRMRLLRLADDDAVRVVETLFPRYVARRSPGSGAAEPDLTLVSVDGAYRLQRGKDRAEVAEADLEVQLEHAVTLLLLEATPDLIHLHAAGVAREGGAVLAIGGSGTGKSSVATAWSAMGHPVLGDDAVLLGPDLTAYPFHKPLKVDARRARAAGVTLEDTLYWHAGAPEVWYDPERAGGWAPASPPAALAFLDRRASGATELERITPLDTARELLGQLLVTSGRPPGWQDTLFDLAEATPAYRVSFSDSSDAARALAALHGAR